MDTGRILRVLHTSDWHLGASIEQVECRDEHKEFLEWLVDQLEERAIDVLVVAGDIFHYQSPGNRDEKDYYDFLVKCAGIETLRKVVIVAGNHDSPSGIDAPRHVLEALDVHVVGALPREKEKWGKKCLAPVKNDDGEVELVVAAVPYVQRARLGVSLEDESDEGLHARFRQAFEGLYQELADRAEETYPGARLVGTGHLTVYGEEDEPEAGDYHTALHHTQQAPRDDEGDEDDAGDGGEGEEEPEDWRTIGTIEAMGPDLFDPRYDYVALGHIHRHMPVGGRRHIRYSGTPIATSLQEDAAARRVVQVDFDQENDEGDPPAIETVEVPKWREKLPRTGTMEELEEKLAELHQSRSFAPALYLTVKVTAEELMADRLGPLQEVLDEAYDEDWRPIIVDIEEERVDEVETRETAETTDLDTSDPRKVFIKMYEREHQPGDIPPEEMMLAFIELTGKITDTDTAEEGDS